MPQPRLPVRRRSVQQINHPLEVNGQRASALRFAEPRVLVLWTALVLFRPRPCGFAHGDLRQYVAALNGQTPKSITHGRMTYGLRRLRLHGFIERISGTHRYLVTEFRLRASLFFTRLHARILRPGLSEAMPNPPPRSNDESSRLKLLSENLTPGCHTISFSP